MKFISGSVYSDGIRNIVIIFSHVKKTKIKKGLFRKAEIKLEPLYAVLSVGRSVIPMMTAPGLYFWGKRDQMLYTGEEFDKYFGTKWKLVDGRLRIEKIDEGMCLGEYTIGGRLEEWEIPKEIIPDYMKD